MAGSGKRLATLVGCNYQGTRYELGGCINDVEAMRDTLVDRFRFDPDDVVVLTDAPGAAVVPTGANIRRALGDMIDAAGRGDVLFFHYSGHSTLIPRGRNRGTRPSILKNRSTSRIKQTRHFIWQFKILRGACPASRAGQRHPPQRLPDRRDLRRNAGRQRHREAVRGVQQRRPGVAARAHGAAEQPRAGDQRAGNAARARRLAASVPLLQRRERRRAILVSVQIDHARTHAHAEQNFSKKNSLIARTN